MNRFVSLVFAFLVPAGIAPPSAGPGATTGSAYLSSSKCQTGRPGSAAAASPGEAAVAPVPC